MNASLFHIEGLGEISQFELIVLQSEYCLLAVGWLENEDGQSDGYGE